MGIGIGVGIGFDSDYDGDPDPGANPMVGGCRVYFQNRNDNSRGSNSRLDPNAA
jgi:hypothetical protein